MKSPNTTLLTGRTRGMLVAVFLLSGSSMAYGMILTRLAALMFQYHDAFLIVTLATAGLSIGAAIAAFATRKPHARPDLVNTSALQALLFIAAAAVLGELRTIDHSAIALVAGMLPFIAIGYLSAVLFSKYAADSSILYAASLLGGAAGLVAALALISVLGTFSAMVALAVISGVLASIFAWVDSNHVIQFRAIGVTLSLTAVLMLNWSSGLIAYSPRILKAYPPEKTMLTLLAQNPTAKITETRWGTFARLDMVEPADDTVRYVFTNAGAASVMVRYTGDAADVAWLQDDLEYLPFVTAADTSLDDPPDSVLNSVLILGTGAGKNILMAHLAGAAAITAVEINSALVELTREQGDYNGHVYDLPGVDTISTDGRTIAARNDTQYDLIYADLAYSQAAMPDSSALAENYIFTREALRTYWDRLSENGRIGFVMRDDIEGQRLLIAALDMLEDSGMSLAEAREHVALVARDSDETHLPAAVVLITRQPWTTATAQNCAEAAHARSSRVVYLPAFLAAESDELALSTLPLDEFIDAHAGVYNLTPATDDRPFFYQIVPGLPEPLSDLMLSSLILLGVYMVLALLFLRQKQPWKRISLAPYFAVLGAAFMLVEIPLIQHFNLLLGQPVLALTLVNGTLLIGGGVGSLLEQRYPLPRLPRLMPRTALIVMLAVIVLRFALPPLIEAALPAPLSVRILIVLALLPLGGLMGMLFPGGLRIAHEADPQGVAAFWGANAVATVLGAALAMGLALTSGFGMVLLLGAVLYALAALLSFTLWPQLI